MSTNENPSPTTSQLLELYQTLFQELPIGIVILELPNPDDAASLVMLGFNPAGRKIARSYVPEDLEGKRLADQFPNVFETVLPRKCVEAIRTGRALQIGLIPYRHAGSPEGTYDAAIVPLPKNRVAVMFTDVSDRIQREEEARVAESRYRTIYEATGVAIFEEDFTDVFKEIEKLRATGVIDVAGYYEKHEIELRDVLSRIRVLDVNAAALTLFEAASKEELLASLDKVMTPVAYPSLREQLAAFARGETSFRTQAPRGTLRENTVEIITTVTLYRERDNTVHAVGSMVDVTAKVRAERDLWRNNLFLESIIENIPDMIFIKDAKKLRFVRFNKAGEELLGFDRRELIGKTDFDFFPKDQAEFFTNKDRQVLLGERILDIPEEPIQTRLKGERWLHTKKIPIKTETGRPLFLLGISEDITERKMADAELRKRTEELAASNRDLEQFAYAASHDMQEPLRMVASYTQLLAQRYEGQLDEKADQYIRYAVDGSKRMQQLINDLLSFSRVGTRARPPERVNTSVVVDRALENLAGAIQESGARVTHDDLPDVVADREQLVQLFQNLIGNAIKFRRDEAPRVHVAASPGDGHFEFTVKDNGIGIAAEHLEKIFGVFQRLHSRGDYPGSGIGLAIAKKIVERHDGKIWVESTPGEGTAFHFTLPAPDAER
ncbi:PAS domain-containing protein [bacterium]|nr:PAS domain-containing protein [bacterium]